MSRSAPLTVEVVIPSVGRPSLHALLAALPAEAPVVVVDDRRDPSAPLGLRAGVRVVTSGGRGPAAARNAGWRAGSAQWAAFLDDDVLPPEGWWDALLGDLGGADPDVGGVQGRIRVPVPAGRRPTDWERNTTGLEHAVWATADLAYRRSALAAVGGFDERFPRAYREDADLGLRITAAGWRITTGAREVVHPVRPAPWDASLSVQRGNRDDALMRALHGRDWRVRAHVPAGRRRWHLVTTGAGLAALGAPSGRLRAGAGALWLGLTADLARRRIAPGPRTRGEVTAMLATSAVIPLAASYHWLAGWAGVRRLLTSGRPLQ